MKNKLPYESTGRAIKGYTDSATARTETNDLRKVGYHLILISQEPKYD